MKIIDDIEKEKKYAVLYEQLFESGNIGRTYAIGISCCLAAHIFYLTVFCICHITEMVIFNILSVTFYFVLLVISRRMDDGFDLFTYLSAFEILIHATAATCLVGWQPDFGMFLLMIIPSLFLIPNKNVYLTYSTAFISIIVYVILSIFLTGNTYVKYEISNVFLVNLITIVNAIMGTATLLYTSAGYVLYRKYLEYNLACLATIDPLTKLRNRRSMNDRIKDVKEACISSGSSYVIGIGDVDNFKKVNDTYGHDMGDTVLVRTAELLRGCITENGYISRWGGEEFLFILSGADISEALALTEEIHSKLRELKFTSGEVTFGITMTFGICEGSGNDNIDSIITKADRRLYIGKNNGKDHTEYTD